MIHPPHRCIKRPLKCAVLLYLGGPLGGPIWRNGSPPHRVDPVVDCGLRTVGPLIFNGCGTLHAVIYADPEDPKHSMAHMSSESSLITLQHELMGLRIS